VAEHLFALGVTLCGQAKRPSVPSVKPCFTSCAQEQHFHHHCNPAPTISGIRAGPNLRDLYVHEKPCGQINARYENAESQAQACPCRCGDQLKVMYFDVKLEGHSCRWGASKVSRGNEYVE
jgi:hypothetical protein